MLDPRVERLARLLVNYCVEVKAGDTVLLSGNLVTRPLLIAAFAEVVKAGGYPLVNWNDTAMQEIMLKQGNDDQLQHIPAPLKLIYETYDCAITLMGN